MHEGQELRIKPGDKVKRIIPDTFPAALKAGQHYFGLDVGMTGTVTEINGDSVYVEECGSWPLHINTLIVVSE
jgi:hypothetical protein